MSDGPGRTPAAWWWPPAVVSGVAAAAWADWRFGWVTPAFDAVAHLFYEVSPLAVLRRPTQVPLVHAHLAVLGTLAALSSVAATRLGSHGRRWLAIFLVGYALRAGAWVAGGNLPLVPGDSCHYLEVATSVYRGEGPVKHYVESYFRDYPAIRAGRGVLDDWATPLYAYALAGAFRLLGVVPGQPLEATVAVAKGVSFLFSLAALPVVYGFGRRRFDPNVGLGAMAVLAVLPVHVIYAGFALRESLVALTTLAAVWGVTEVWAARGVRAAWGWGVAAGLMTGLAILARNTAMAVAAGVGLFALARHGRRRLGPLLTGGAVTAAVIAPWAWATYQEYGQPFYSYTSYFQYNFSWTVHHYDRGNTLPSQFYTRANASEIVRTKVKSLAIIAVTSAMILSPPLLAAALARVRRGGDADRLVGVLGAVFVAATLTNIADVTQVAQLGRYYLPLFVVALPTAVAGLRDAWRGLSMPARGVRWVGLTILALLWADPTWAYDAGWFGKPYQLHWPALRAAGSWVRSHPEAVPADARVICWFPWEFRVASDRTTVLFPRNYDPRRLNEEVRRYGVTHVLWGSFEPPADLEPGPWAAYLDGLRLGAGLTDDRLLYRSDPRGPYPVRLYRIR